MNKSTRTRRAENMRKMRAGIKKMNNDRKCNGTREYVEEDFEELEIRSTSRLEHEKRKTKLERKVLGWIQPW